jgi:transposase
MEIKRSFSQAEWLKTPETVRLYIEMLEKSLHHLSSVVAELQGRTENLEKQVSRNSQNSNQPPSADGPFKKPKRDAKKKTRKRGGQKGHPGHRQQLLQPKEVVDLMPERCPCGCRRFKQVEEFYVHQQIEFPEIDLDITHYVLHRGCCSQCGKTVSAGLDSQKRLGYGPRMSAVIAELSGIHGASRQAVQQFINSVLGVPISTGGIQKVIDRDSNATRPAYEKIAEVARNESVGFVDETSWRKGKDLHWLWVMASQNAAFYLLHPHRSREAFETLVQDWQGILVSDKYPVYQKWVNQRQSCLAHYIRKARGLSEARTRRDRTVWAGGAQTAAVALSFCQSTAGGAEMAQFLFTLPVAVNAS